MFIWADKGLRFCLADVNIADVALIFINNIYLNRDLILKDTVKVYFCFGHITVLDYDFEKVVLAILK